MADIDETQVEDKVEVGETVEAQEEKEPIPDELAGIPEDIAREAMEEAKASSKQETDQQEDEDQDAGEEAYTAGTGDGNTENKDASESDVLPNQRIPYKRFKQQVDKTHQLEQQIAQLQAQLAAKPTMQMVQPQQAVPQQAVQQPQAPQTKQAPVINAEVMKQLNQVIEAEAMKMTGMSREDIDSMEYMDDDDNRKQTWTTAKELAKAEVFQKMQQARAQQINESRRRIAAHNENVLAYNNFARAQMAEPDFENIKNFAINDFFSQQDKRTQNVIAEAYTRIERNQGSPQDTMLVERFFTDAKNEYRKSSKAPAAKSSNNNTANKVKQGQAFPRSGQVSGVSDDGGAVTAETLENMLETMPFEKIPEQYQKMLLGYGG